MGKQRRRKKPGAASGKYGTSHKPSPPLKCLRSGIRGLDTVLYGGLPAGRCLLIIGGPGNGKSVLLNEFLYRGIEAGQNGVFITVEETPDQVITNAATFGWDYKKLIRCGQLAFVDASLDPSSLAGTTETSQDYNLMPLVLRLRHTVKEIGAKRVVLDSIGALFAQFQSQSAVRYALHFLVEEMRRLGITGMLSSEDIGTDSSYSGHGIEEYVVDGVIRLTRSAGQLSTLRHLEVTKLRGCNYRSGPIVFDIDSRGLTMYPKIEADYQGSGSVPSRRLSSGIPDLDSLLGKGFPKGHLTLVSGNTGTGKSMFGMHFLNAAIERGETAIYVNLEESTQQVCRFARIHGWDFRAHAKKGDLIFLCPSLIDMGEDKLLFQIVEAVEQTGATTLFLDSISSIPSATYSEEQTRQFVLQLVRLLKSHRITGLFTHMSSQAFGSSSEQRLGNYETNEMRLASMVDGIILLRYGERMTRVVKYLSILKMRGIYHDKGIHEYEIGKGTITINDHD